MSRLSFFLKFYQTCKLKFFILVLIFAFAGSILSCSLLVQRNNKVYGKAQIENIVGENLIEGDEEQEEYDLLFGTMEKVMTLFSLGSILIVVWGCTSILFFQNISMEKSHAMLRIFGMQKKDIFVKALVEGLGFGLLGGLVGDAGGYVLFFHLSKKLCGIDVSMSKSKEMLLVFPVVLFVLVIIAFFASLISGLFIYEKPVTVMLYKRGAKKDKQTYLRYGILEFIILYSVTLGLFFKNKSYINGMLILCSIIFSLLFGVFHFMFQGQGRKREKGTKPLDQIWSLSYRFLCTRKRRDALLASTISVGAVIICIVLNVVFNFSGILRDAYRDNMGYSTAVWMENSLDEEGRIQSILDENGYGYTMVYSKLMKYNELSGFPLDDNYFWAMIINRKTDSNIHFKVAEGTFAAENRFAGICGLKFGQKSSLFGRELTYSDIITDSQWLSQINYSIKVNREDWELNLDESFHTCFLMDIDRAAEEKLETLLSQESCSVNTASALVDELSEILSDYLSVVSLVGLMLILVTGTFFYSMVRSDLLARKKELYLYQIYGASRKKAFWVVYLEYLMIAWIASFCVVFVTMVLGESIFYFMLKRHYPLSIPVVFITSFVVTLFVLFCCMAAQWINFVSGNMEIIRDE